MTDKSDFDIAVDFLLEDVKALMGETHKMFKGKRPFRSVKMSDEEAISKYIIATQYTPDIADVFRQSNPESWNEYEQDIFKRMEGLNAKRD